MLSSSQMTPHAAAGAGLKLRMKNNQKGFNFNFLRDDTKFTEIVIYETVKLKKKNFQNRKIQTSES